MVPGEQREIKYPQEFYSAAENISKKDFCGGLVRYLLAGWVMAERRVPGRVHRGGRQRCGTVGCLSSRAETRALGERPVHDAGTWQL